MVLLTHLSEALERFAHDVENAGKDVRREVMEAVRAGLHELHEEVEKLQTDLQGWALAHPEKIFGILRRIQPILVVKSFALVTRFEDVQEVLARDDVFDVPYAERMKVITDGENFFLGMRDGPRYTRDHSNMMSVVRRQDVTTIIEPLVSKVAKRIVDGAGGALDVVQRLTRPVAARTVADYFALPGPSASQMIEWTSTLFWFLFLDQANDPAVREKALLAGRGLDAYLDGAIKARKEGTPAPGADTVLDRCLALQAAGVPGMRDLDIRNDLLGLVIGAIPTTATTAALALDELLDRPEQLAGAHAAAKAGDHELVARYVFEALRFRPMNPGIFRIANQDFELARGEHRATVIPKGATVVAATQSAMFDTLRIEEPAAFRLDRSPRDYMFWGYALHTCFGQYINQVQIPHILEPLLARPNLRRAAGDAGTLTREGPFAGSLHVTFD